MTPKATSTAPDFDLTTAELRAVAAFAARHAQDVLGVFEAAVPGDQRPRAAVDAALLFAGGAPRSAVQRRAAADAHRAARQAPSEPARLAALAAGDAAAAAYLHPLARSSQLAHLLRSAAAVAAIAEVSGAEPAAAALLSTRRRATPVVLAVLRRYPSLPEPPAGASPVTRLLVTLDRALRADTGTDAGADTDTGTGTDTGARADAAAGADATAGAGQPDAGAPAAEKRSDARSCG